MARRVCGNCKNYFCMINEYPCSNCIWAGGEKDEWKYANPSSFENQRIKAFMEEER